MIRSRRTLRKNPFAIIAASLVLAPAATASEQLDSVKTAAIVLPFRIGDRVPDRSLAHITRLKVGLEALSHGEVLTARDIRDTFPVTSLEYRILMWAIAVRGGRDVPGAEIAAASTMFRNWAGAISLRRNSERAFVREKPEPLAAIEAFRETPPETLEGIILLARSHVALGQIPAARAVVSPLWRTETL